MCKAVDCIKPLKTRRIVTKCIKNIVVWSTLLLAGCAGKPIIQTQVLDRPTPVYCKIQMPPECKDAYAVDRISPKDDALTINRAMRIELEERAACEIKLRAAIKGCNYTIKVR